MRRRKTKGRLAYEVPEVSEKYVRYILHVGHGMSLRELARWWGVAPSTISRQVRAVEDMREEPLTDDLLGARIETYRNSIEDGNSEEILMEVRDKMNENMSEVVVAMHAKRILRRLLEKGAFILASPEMEMAAVFRPGRSELQRLAVVGRDVVEEFLLRDWIKGQSGKAVGGFVITEAGRKAFRRLTHKGKEGAEAGLAEASTPYLAQHQHYGDKRIDEEGKTKRYRVNYAESPLAMLARKKGPDGMPFVTHRQVVAGERLREDYEVAQIGPRVAQNWDRFLVSAGRGQFYSGDGTSAGAEAARKRFGDAMATLGSGLSEIAFRCCCLEGL